jgi:asparagine synthase (glutamine-hydrolysing)
MCGINGILSLNDQVGPIDREELIRTREAMATRGPDAAGEWVSPDGKIGLGHRRLAIIDLSSSGSQPMHWEAGRYTIVFNGEIYNYRELRAELERAGVRFQSQSDTEVILALYARRGLAMLSCLRGMYAFAIWDAQEHTLLLARDPFGIKPLYYSIQDGVFRFASQVKALQASNAILQEPDPSGIVGFLLWGSVPEPFTIYRAIRALPAGSYLLVRNGQVTSPCPFYSWNALPSVSYPDVASALMDTVRAHLVADVPVAIFLSGGLDSTLIAALACRLSASIQTFSLGFESFLGKPYDELPLARQVAQRLGIKHIEVRIKPTDMPDLWHRALSAMDQPSIDGFNVFVISQLAHSAGLKVVLSGLGGDELFGSYSSFRDVPHWYKWSSRLIHMPGLTSRWHSLAHRLYPTLPKLQGLLRYATTLPGAYYLRRGLYLPEELPQIIDPHLAREGLDAYQPVESLREKMGDLSEPWHIVHRLEVQQYMRNQLLRDADWASMAHSLELRVPLVDIWLHAYLSRQHFEPARSRGKAALVRRVAPELPDELFRRAKSGFLFPIREWLEPTNPNHSVRWGLDSRRLAVRVLHEFMPAICNQ